MTDLPKPPVPANADLRGMLYMPLDVQRLLDSDLFITCTGDEFKAAVALWCKSWSQVPAASLPDDDRILADYSRAGAKWKKIKDAALRGWFKADDGRLYHPVVAEKARDAWESRLAQRARTEAARAARAASNKSNKAQTTDTVTEPVTEDVAEQSQRPSKVNGIVKGYNTPAAAAAVVAPDPPAASDGARAKIQGVDRKRAQRAVASANPLGVIAAFGGTRDEQRDAEWIRDAGGMVIGELVAVLWLALTHGQAVRQPSGLRAMRAEWDSYPVDERRAVVREAFEALGIPIPAPRRPPADEDEGEGERVSA